MNISGIIYIYIIVSLLIAAAYSIATILALHARRKKQRLKQLSNSYLQQIIAMQGGEGKVNARSTSERMALAQALHSIMSHTYSTPTENTKAIARNNRLEELILNKLRHANNEEKARLLNILSSIPISTRATDIISKYLHSANRHIRIAAIIATIAASPTKAIRIIADLPFSLKPYDTSRIIALLRRGLLPIAYEPLLMSDNHNLLMLGIAITHNFGIDIADKHLHNIILRQPNRQIVREAIYTLATLGRPLGRHHIREQLAAMSPNIRRELCHHLSCEGYSLSALSVIFSESEILHAEPLINSYKRSLICTQSN